ncbi:MAG: surfeit locus 1 family protein [Halieaceae bacterium]|jgi:surfeit locus 1 family protein
MRRLELDLEWRMTLLTVLLLPMLVALGFWQLQRADEKRELAERYSQRAAQAPVSLAALRDATSTPHERAFRRVYVSGHFVPEVVILLDNQVRDGRYGQDVLALFEDRESEFTVLLNRGWVPADPARRSLPQLEVPTGEIALLARVYVSPGEPYLLAEENFGEVTWPLLVQSPSSGALRQALQTRIDTPLFPQQLRLAADAEHGFRRDWPVVNVSPEKHQGYALQWFTMAAALLVFFCLRSSNLAAVLRSTRKDD